MKKFLFVSVLAVILGSFSSCNTCYTCQQNSISDGGDTSLRGNHVIVEVREVCSRSERRQLEKSSQDNADGRIFWTCDRTEDLEQAQADIDELNNNN